MISHRLLRRYEINISIGCHTGTPYRDTIVWLLLTRREVGYFGLVATFHLFHQLPVFITLA